jgi:dCMP deaminase
MIVGITGGICVGKHTMVQYLIQTYNFEAVNLLVIFKSKLSRWLLQMKKQKDCDNQEEEPILDDMFFCFAYYQVKWKELRLRVIKETFRDLCGKWDRNFVIYPISGQEDIKLMISRFYFLCYEIDAPLKTRYERFCIKYSKQELTLDQFVEVDDKIKFNTEEFSLYVGSADR